jgi:hypothetical protein
MAKSYDRIIDECIISEEKRDSATKKLRETKEQPFDVFNTKAEPPRSMDLVELLERSGVSTS